MQEFLVVGGVWFWVAIAAETILLMYWIAQETGIASTVSLVVTLVVFQWVFKLDILGSVAEWPLCVIGGVAAYLLLGTLWTIVKWWFYVKEERRKYDEFRMKWLRENCDSPTGKWLASDAIPAQRVEDFHRALPRWGECKIDCHPLVAEHKELIYLWLAYWPWSFLWTMIDDPVRKMFRAIYRAIRAYLQRMSDKAWKGTEGELPRF